MDENKIVEVELLSELSAAVAAAVAVAEWKEPSVAGRIIAEPKRIKINKVTLQAIQIL